MKLEQIKIPNPWSMISQPTIDRIKVYPNKKNFAIAAFLASIFLGTILSFIKEKYSGIIYDISVVNEEIDCKYLGQIYF